MAQIRTQIYLTAEQRARLESRMRAERRTLASLIREAIDAFLGSGDQDAEQVMAETFGADPGFTVPPRSEWRARGERLARH